MSKLREPSTATTAKQVYWPPSASDPLVARCKALRLKLNAIVRGDGEPVDADLRSVAKAEAGRKPAERWMRS